MTRTVTDPTRELHELLQQEIAADRLPSHPLLAMKVTTLICQGANLDACDSDGFTPLLRCLNIRGPAIGESTPRIHPILHGTLRAILRGGPDFQVPAPDGRAAETLAAIWPIPDATQLIDAEKQARARRPSNWSRPTFLLFYLLQTPHDDMSPLQDAALLPLIDAGADLAVRDADGHNALHLLLRRGPSASANLGSFYLMVRKFLRHGADIDTRAPDGASVEQLAAVADDEDLSLRCIQVERVRRRDPYLRQNVNEVQFWWPQPGTVPRVSDHGEFFTSCQKGNLDHLRYMLHVHKACRDWVKDDGATPLGLALMSGQQDAARTLVEFGTPVNRPDPHGMTPLMQACKWADAADMIEWLVERGADETATCAMGLTAAQYARTETADAGALPRLNNAIARRDQQRAAQHAAMTKSLARSRKFRL